MRKQAESLILRSLLFVPADSEKKLAKAEASPADALILDLEDSVAARKSAQARATGAGISEGARIAQSIWVRINPLGSARFHPDHAKP